MRQLEILAEVARVGTFRGAARHLGLSQVAVSDHIRQLESRLGCALFVRNAGGKPSLTPSGKVVLEHGRNVLFACDSLISAARGAAGMEPEALSVSVRQPVEDAVALSIPEAVEQKEQQAAPPVALEYADDLDTAEVNRPMVAAPEPDVAEAAQVVPMSLLAAIKDAPAEIEPLPPVETIPVDAEGIAEIQPEPEADREKPITVASHPAILSRFQDKLAAAQEAFPDRPIAVDYARFTPEAIAAPLASGRVDIALFYALGEVPGLASEYLWSESWSLFARADHPLAQADVLHLSDCVDMPVILFEENNPLRALCEACLVKAGLWPAPTVLETDDFAAIATELLEYGEAVFPAFGVTAAQFAARAGLKRLSLAEPLPGVQVRRAVGPLSDEDPTVSALAGLLG